MPPVQDGAATGRDGEIANRSVAPRIDRVLAPLGAARILRGQAGLGWMLIEVIPVIVWARLTGAFNYEGGYYLTAWLGLLGAGPEAVAWLPLLFFAGTALSAVLVIARRDRYGRLQDPRRTCLRDCWLGRGCWLLALCWPPLATRFGLAAWAGLAGALLMIALGQVLLLASASAWTSWTQGIVAPEQRRPFFAWRNLASMSATAATLACLGLWWPDESASLAVQANWYQRLFIILTLICLCSTLILHLAPRLPPDRTTASDSRAVPMRQALYGHRRFFLFGLWHACHLAATALALTWLRPVVLATGADDAVYVHLDGWMRTPALLLGILVAGWGLRRLGTGRLLVGANLLLVTGLIAIIGLGEGNWRWLLPLAMICDGAGRGLLSVLAISMVQSLIPGRDARFPALYMGLGGLGGVIAATGQLLWGDRVDPQRMIHLALACQVLGLLVLWVISRTGKAAAR